MGPVMSAGLELLMRGVVIGIGGALLMDLWSLVLRRGLGIPTLDYALLGRWIGHFKHGRVRHVRIAQAEPVVGEGLLGWSAHYAIGIVFAWLLLACWGLDWARSPTIWPALIVGLGTIVAPWFVMQPAMGAGIAASRTPAPRATRVRNLGTHTIYGLGVYLSAVAVATLQPGGAG
jgi:Protein of unknown function (DUF2938)